MPYRPKKMEKRKLFQQTVNMNVNSPIFVPHRIIQNAALHVNWAGYQQYGTQIGGITYYQPMQWVQIEYQLNSMQISTKKEYKKDDSVIHNCSQGCHHNQKKSGIGSDIGTTNSHNQQQQQHQHNHQKQGVTNSSGNKSSKGRNSTGGSGSGGSINKRHEKNQTHPWLVTSLKGHTDEVRDIDFSSNGKYLASCAEDNNSGHRNSTSSDLTDDVNSSSNEDMPAITIPKSSKKSQKSGRSRRQKKTHHHLHHHHRTITMDIDDESKENHQPTILYANNLRKQGKTGTSLPLSPTNDDNNNNNNNNSSNNSQKELSSLSSSSNFPKIDRRLIKIGAFQQYINCQQELQLMQVLHDYYLVHQNDLRRYGYPVESDVYDGSVEIFKSPFPRWIAPRKTWEDYDTNAMQVSGDSGQGSSSSPNSTDSETVEEDSPETGAHLYSYCDQSLAKQCDRCKRPFLVTNTGEYLTQEECAYHWGRISTVYIHNLGYVSHYMCCNSPLVSRGCVRGKAHVWSGLSVGVNGPFNDFVKTEQKVVNSSSNNKRGQQNVYALDCEMCFTGLGLELAQVTVIGVNGDVVYEHFVRPQADIVDYNTRFSGISEKHLRHDSVKSIQQVQTDLLELFNADTVLIGHGLENDLRALKLVHEKIVDTSLLFPHNQGFPYKRKLKHLTRQILRREIQTDVNGHSSLEDSRACLELTLWKVRKEHGFLQQQQQQSSGDRTILIWACSQIDDAKNRKSFRVNVEYDTATKLAWSPDSKAIAIHKAVENCIEVYKVEKRDGWFVNPSKGLTFPKVTDNDIIGFGIACTGRFIMTCTNGTELYIWDLKGNILDKIDTYLMNTYSAKISPCGRFIAACGFAPDCKVWEVKFSKTGEYQKTARVFDLSGHSSGIYDLAFDQDTSHIGTVSKDGTWKLYNTKVEYEKGQSPRCLKTVKYNVRSNPALMALSPNAEVLVIANGTSIEVFSTLTGECDAVIKNVYDWSINALKFDSMGKYFFTAGDKQIRIYHNVTGYKTAISVAEKKLKTNLTEATRERLMKQVNDNNKFLKKFL